MSENSRQISLSSFYNFVFNSVTGCLRSASLYKWHVFGGDAPQYAKNPLNSFALS